eukprot:TRINITY_DN11546_c0_g1_i1.p1 TRINITY_DN11546_c0_g1~~TRINITY_DN11546_c0_g1_i1.p1  ORF type:complete len:418 (+),score=134.21 TRINITY_DN11546_c0_g1_i1:92-1255(+)
MPHHLTPTEASRGWVQPALKIHKPLRMVDRVYARQVPETRRQWASVAPEPRAEQAEGDPGLERDELAAVFSVPFDELIRANPRLLCILEGQQAVQWHRDRWDPSHPDHERCRHFIGALQRSRPVITNIPACSARRVSIQVPAPGSSCGSDKGGGSAIARPGDGAGSAVGSAAPPGSAGSARRIAELRQDHLYQRQVAPERPAPALEAAAREAAKRVRGAQITRYEAVLDARRSKDAAARAYSNDYRQELGQDGRPMVATLLAGAFHDPGPRARKRRAPVKDHLARNRQRVKSMWACLPAPVAAAAMLGRKAPQAAQPALSSAQRSRSAERAEQREELRQAGRRSHSTGRVIRQPGGYVAYNVTSPPRSRAQQQQRPATAPYAAPQAP